MLLFSQEAGYKSKLLDLHHLELHDMETMETPIGFESFPDHKFKYFLCKNEWENLIFQAVRFQARHQFS